MMRVGGHSVATQFLAYYTTFLRNPRVFLRAAMRELRYGLGRISGWPGGAPLANGNTIAAQLARAEQKRGGLIQTGSRIYSLVCQVGRVTGVTGPDGADCRIVTDHAALRRCGLGPFGPTHARLGPALSVRYLVHGATPERLAMANGLSPVAVTASIARFKAATKAGHDPDFGRGDSAYDRGNGDPSHRPRPTRSALDRGPFYVIRISPGDIGTFIALRTDADARVLDEDARRLSGCGSYRRRGPDLRLSGDT